MPIRRRPVEDDLPWEEEKSNRSVAQTDERRAVQPYQKPAELVPGYGNIDATDLVVPRIKLLQGMSEECKPTGGSHPQGHWFHTSEGRTIGTEIEIISLGVKKTVEVWPPRNSDQEGDGILARSSDGIHWDEGSAHREFVITFDDGHREVWRTRGNVAESGFTQFRDGRAPIAGFTFRLALYLPEFPQYPASLYIASRTATQGVLDLNGRVNSRHIGGTPFWAQRYTMRAYLRKGAKNLSWYVPSFANLPPLADKHLIEELKARSESIYRANVTTYDEDERLSGRDGQGHGKPSPRPQGRERNRDSTY